MRVHAREGRFLSLPTHFPVTSLSLPPSIREATASGNGSDRLHFVEATREAMILALARQAVPMSEIVEQVYMAYRVSGLSPRASQEIMTVISRALPPESVREEEDSGSTGSTEPTT